MPRPPLPPRFLLQHPAHFLALGFGAGLLPAAGTCGTLLAWLLYVLGLKTLPLWGWLLLFAIALPLGLWAAERTARALNQADANAIVLDEILAFWLLLVLSPATSWQGQALAFALFRLLDIVKPGPIGWAQRHWHGFGRRGAWGIYADDLLAALIAALVMRLI